MDRTSKAFDEFIARRCEEIASCNPEYQRLTKEVSEASSKLKDAYMDFANKTSKLQAYAESLMLKSDYKTRLNTEQDTAQKIISRI